MNEEAGMQTAVERVMQTYGLMVSLTAKQEREARERVSRFLETKAPTNRVAHAARAS
jgi:hypothetical protein